MACQCCCYEEGFDDAVRERKAVAPKEMQLLTERVAELEELIADFFRGIVDADDLRKAVSA